MFFSTKSSNLINKILERSLWVISDGKESDSQTLLENHSQLIIHQRNLQRLMIEVYKILNDHAPPNHGKPVVFRGNKHNIRNVQLISNKNIKT